MEIETNHGLINIDIDDQEIYERITKTLSDSLSELPDKIGEAINKLLEIDEENIKIYFWAEGDNGQGAEIHVGMQIGNEDDFINKSISLKELIQVALQREDKQLMLFCAKQLRELADYIERELK